MRESGQQPPWIKASGSRFRELLRTTWGDRTGRTAVAAMLVIDLVWIVWYSFARMMDDLELTSRFYDMRLLRLTADLSLPEWFNYAELALIVFLLARLAWRTRQGVYAAFALFFAVVLADDSLGIHEGVARLLIDRFEMPDFLELRPHEIGELVTWAGLGAFVVPPVMFTFIRADRDRRLDSLALMIPLGVLLFCAVVVDQLYTKFAHSFFGAGLLLDLAEDGGEMLAVTLTCAVVIGMDLRRQLRSAR